MAARRIVDLSHPLGGTTPVYPGDGAVRVTHIGGTSIQVSRIDFSVHTGTHMDAPYHLLEDAPTIDRVPLERCSGPARLIDLRDIATQGEIRREHIEKRARGSLQAHAAILHTGWSKHSSDPNYFSEHPVLTGEAAQFLSNSGVLFVGVDMPSVDHAPYPAHRILLAAGIPIVENLTNLDSIGADLFHIIALPLRLLGLDGSPVRAIALVAEP